MHMFWRNENRSLTPQTKNKSDIIAMPKNKKRLVCGDSWTSNNIFITVIKK